MTKVLKTLCVFFVLLITLLCGCNNSNSTADIITDFSAKFTAHYKNLSLSGSVSNNRQGITNIEITSPKTVEGIHFNYKNSELEMGRENLVCSADEVYLPNKSFPSILKSILNSLNNGSKTLTKKSEATNTYQIKTEQGNCKLTVDFNGKILSAEIPDCNTKIEFSDYKTTDN